MKLIPIFAVAALAIPSFAQTGGKAKVFSGKDVSAQLATLAQTSKASGSSGATLGDYTSHAIKLSVRTASGGAEIHAHYDDIFVVTEGKATLITGGTVMNAQTGERRRNKRQQHSGWNSRRRSPKNDIVHIPAGTPHQLIIAPGDVFSTIVVKVKE